jgi:hypothetical protein
MKPVFDTALLYAFKEFQVLVEQSSCKLAVLSVSHGQLHVQFLPKMTTHLEHRFAQ